MGGWGVTKPHLTVNGISSPIDIEVKNKNFLSNSNNLSHFFLIISKINNKELSLFLIIFQFLSFTSHIQELYTLRPDE